MKSHWGAAIRAALPLALILACGSSPRLEAQTQLRPDRVDFGDCGHNEKPSAKVVIENRGASPLTIREIRTSCSCIDVSPRTIQMPIAPGGSETITVSMGSNRAMGVLDKYLTIVAADAAIRPVTLPVHMRVFPGFAMEPRELRFDGVCGGRPLTLGLELRRKDRRPFTLTLDGVKDVNPPRVNPHFEGKVGDLQEGARRIELTLKPTHPEGKIWANLEARLDGKLLVVPVVGEMFRWIKVIPTHFNFSRVSSDDPSTFIEESVLTSTDEKPFKILAMTPTFRGPAPAGIRLELELKGAKPGDASTEHVIRARIVPPQPPAVGAQQEGPTSPGGPASQGGAPAGGAGGAPAGPPAPGPKAPAQPPFQGSFSGTVVVKTDRPEKPELKFQFFGFLAEPRK